MLCERCGQREATIHEVLIQGGEQVDRNLCEQCASQAGVDANLHVPINELIAKYILSQSSPAAAKAWTEEGAPRADEMCGGCGLRFSDFHRTGLLGCEHCYREFERRLGPLLERAQDGGTHHVGKLPRRALSASRWQASMGKPEAMEALLGSLQERAERLRLLRSQLEQAVTGEDFERAARLRDEISRASEPDAEAAGGTGPVKSDGPDGGAKG